MKATVPRSTPPRLMLTLLVGGAGACTDPAAPHTPASRGGGDVVHLAKTPDAARAALVAAQGTYCDVDDLPCEPNCPDMGYTIAWRRWETDHS